MEKDMKHTIPSGFWKALPFFAINMQSLRDFSTFISGVDTNYLRE